ncbi:hypothetical protein CTAYLR_001968 [Chrysophaeum taylorii]|uniref:Acyltransferase 3 domain-containing protein n=1 Tax=Chrysophaeum taylorii TaxID=2483200 RepID=A0AAD7U9A6_9STRA|nr:hypothetical protein CTAYLR_001968 [Chrysophaeum taylorii]
MAEPSQRVRLQHLAGTRFVASLWIVCQHFLPSSRNGRLVRVLWRSNVGVDYFIILSGFVTHWASRGTKVRLAPWFARRFGRVLASTYLSMMAAMAIFAIQRQFDELVPGHVARCALLVETWLDPQRWCPNGQIWTVAALAPSWVLYPFLLDRIAKRALIPATVIAALVPTCVSLWYVVRNGGASELDQAYMYLWPPSQLLDFALGACAAEWAARADISHRHGRLADAAFAIVLALSFSAPNPNLDYRDGYEPLFDHGLAPVLALFLYASAVDGRRATYLDVNPTSATARMFAHPALTSLGVCSFQVYLFQWPVHAIFGMIGLDTQKNGAAENFVAFALTLWLLAALYERYLERPFVAWL